MQDILPLISSTRLRNTAEERFSMSLAAFPRKTAEEVLKAMSSLFPDVNESIAKLAKAMDRQPINLLTSSSGWGVMAQEKEALDTALTLAGVKRVPIALRNEEDGPAPILELLGDSTLEDRVIEQDARVFGGLVAIKDYVRGARVFWDPRGKGKVTVVNVNRAGLESTLGVDLIVYFQEFKSYLLIQYKRMTREHRENGPAQWWYRPVSDGSFKKEVTRINALRSELPTPVKLKNPLNARLNNDPFYFKFTKSDEFKLDSIAMAPGLYVLQAHLRDFLDSKKALGPGKGVRFGHDNFKRRFSNTLFCDLGREGWIGSTQLGSEIIDRYIRKAMKSSRSVLVASVASASEPDDD